MTSFLFEPENIKATNEPLHQGVGLVSMDENGPYAALTPLMLDEENKQLKLWDKTAGTAVALSVFEVDNSTVAAEIPFYKSGAIKASAINWPEDTTDNEKQVAFIGSPISIYL